MNQNRKRSTRRGALSGRWASNQTGIFVGPSVDGSDQEYRKTISGPVSNKKPSFAKAR